MFNCLCFLIFINECLDHFVSEPMCTLNINLVSIVTIDLIWDDIFRLQLLLMDILVPIGGREGGWLLDSERDNESDTFNEYQSKSKLNRLSSLVSCGVKWKI